MHKLFALLALIASVLGALILGYMFYGFYTTGFGDGAGMAIIALQLYGALFAAFGLGFGLISRLLAQRKNVAPMAIAKLSIGISCFSLAALIIAQIVLK